MIVCSFDNVQWRWALNDRLARGYGRRPMRHSSGWASSPAASASPGATRTSPPPATPARISRRTWPSARALRRACARPGCGSCLWSDDGCYIATYAVVPYARGSRSAHHPRCGLPLGQLHGLGLEGLVLASTAAHSGCAVASGTVPCLNQMEIDPYGAC